MSKIMNIEKHILLETLCWIILVITILTMLIAVGAWSTGSIATLVYTTLVFIQTVWILIKLKEKLE